jgi:hypothetical protein
MRPQRIGGSSGPVPARSASRKIRMSAIDCGVAHRG